MPIQIQVDYNHTEFTPGDTISGKVQWGATHGETVELRLFWFTSGKGTQDIEVVQEASWPAGQGQGDFSFPLPNDPYSFSGTLVSLNWALEAVLLPDDESVKYEFQLTPDGRPIRLDSVQDSVAGSQKKKWLKAK